MPYENQNTRTSRTVGGRDATIHLPVTINPFSMTGPAVVRCCGEPVIENHAKADGGYQFTIIQKVEVEIPVEFGASVQIGDTLPDGDCSNNTKIQENCENAYTDEAFDEYARGEGDDEDGYEYLTAEDMDI